MKYFSKSLDSQSQSNHNNYMSKVFGSGEVRSWGYVCNVLSFVSWDTGNVVMELATWVSGTSKNKFTFIEEAVSVM